MILTAKNLKKSFEDRELFSEINLDIPYGKKIAITGRSGSGKTTLLNILGLLESADTGEILIHGEPVKDRGPKIRNRSIGFVFQFHYLNPDLTVFENLELPRLIQKSTLSKQEAQDLLKLVNLEDKIDSMAKHLSGGQKQRVAFSRALVNNPDLILADEPTGQLDQQQAEEMIRLLLSLPQAVVLVTHDRQFASRMDEKFELLNHRLISW
ncbi:MAG: ATP-binding cassette domain-containing protein [Chlamydiae bacterium]|nr:ATP-binding cassette domain-containing protein [Chlamydiota bacterium]